MMTRGLRSLSGALVVALGVLASAGCGGGKKDSPLEQWKDQAGERRVGVVTYTQSTKMSESLPPGSLLVLADPAAKTAEFGASPETLAAPVAIGAPELLSAVSSARGLFLVGGLPKAGAGEEGADPGAMLKLAIRSRQSAGIPIVTSPSIAGSANLGAPAIDLWQEGIVLWAMGDATPFATSVDDLAKIERPFVVIVGEKDVVSVDQSSRRLAVGESGVELLDFTDAKVSRKGRQVENVRLTILCPGDAFDLAERRVRFAAGKSIHGSNTTLPMEKDTNPTDPDTILRMAARLADSAPGSTLAADFGPDGLLILTRDAETIAFRPLAEGEGNKGAKLDIAVGPDTPWTISRLRLDIVPAK